MPSGQKIKIAYLDYSHVFAGAERVLHTIISTLDRNKYSPFLIFPYPEEHQAGYNDLTDCKRIYLAPEKKWWMGSNRWKHPLPGTDMTARTIWGMRLAYTLKKHKVDILHVNLLRPDSLMWLLPAKQSGVKIIGHFRSQAIEWIAPSSVQKQCDLILCVSRYSRDRMLSKGIHTKSSVLYDSIEISKFNANLDLQNSRKELQLPSDAIILASVGQLSRHKGHDNAIKAFAKIATKYPKAVLYIAGGGADSQYLKTLADNYPILTGRIIFSNGQIPDVQKVYSAADVILTLTKVGEAFGLVPHEASLMNKPFIGPDKGAVLEFIRDGYNGMLVDTNNVDAIANKIDWALSHPKECHNMVGKARELVMQQLTPKVMIGNLHNTYNQIMNRGN